MRMLLFLGVALVSLAFAPAPLPRTVRQKPNDFDDLKKIQGQWVRQGDGTLLDVREDFLRFPEEGDSWKLTLDPRANPKRIDFVHTSSQIRYYGIYRVEGDTWTYCVSAGEESNRPRDFDPELGTLRINKRKR